MTRTQASLSVIAVTLATVTTLFLLPYTPKIPVQTAIVRRGEWTKTTLAEGVVQYRQQQPAVCLQGACCDESARRKVKTSGKVNFCSPWIPVRRKRRWNA